MSRVSAGRAGAVRGVVALGAALLGLALLVPSAAADLWVGVSEGADGTTAEIYEAGPPESFPPNADRLAIAQPLGPDSLRFQITEGSEVILITGLPETPCTGYATQTVNCDFTADGLDRLEVRLGEFDDIASSTGSVPTEWFGGPGEDEITGGTGPNWIEGGAESDQLKGRQGVDEILGQAGPDAIDGGSGGDTLDGGSEGDTINGEGGPDVLTGGTQNDTLKGGSDADELYGGDGEDNLEGGNGPDYISGGSGFFGDTVTYAARLNPISVSIDGLANDGGPEDGHGDNVDPDVEILIAGSGDDQLISASHGAEIDGGAGDDTFTGGPGYDLFRGSAGNDTMTLGGGPNHAMGGVGNDTLIGGAYNEQLDGGAGDDTLVGGAGTDRLEGMDGSDELNAVDGAVDLVIDCGLGVDSALSDPIDPAAMNCETDEHPPDPADPGDPGDPTAPPASAPLGQLVGKNVPVKFPSQRRPKGKRKPTARPRLACPAQATSACTGEIVLKAKRARKRGAKGSKRAKKLIKVAKGRYQLDPGARKRITVKLNRKGRRLLSRKRRTKGRAILSGSDRLTQKVTLVRKR